MNSWKDLIKQPEALVVILIIMAILSTASTFTVQRSLDASVKALRQDVQHLNMALGNLDAQRDSMDARLTLVESRTDTNREAIHSLDVRVTRLEPRAD